MSRDFLQFSYVTNDLGQALEVIRATHRMGPFKEMRDLALPVGDGAAAHCHFALAFKGGAQFEIIQPVGGDIGIYQSSLPDDDGFSLVFHHLGHHIGSVQSYRQALGTARASWPIPIEMAEFGGYYAYADARKGFGHYLEYFCFPPDSKAIEAPHY